MRARAYIWTRRRDAFTCTAADVSDNDVILRCIALVSRNSTSCATWSSKLVAFPVTGCGAVQCTWRVCVSITVTCTFPGAGDSWSPSLGRMHSVRRLFGTVPGIAHGKQSDGEVPLLLLRMRPGGHCAQFVCPAAALNVPASHSRQNVVPVALCW